MKIRFIAEIGANHNKNLKRCRSLIDKAQDCGFTDIKFQLFDTEKLISKNTKSFYKKNFKIFKKFELPKKFIPIISKYCKKKRIKFGCSVFGIEDITYLKKYVNFFKISSYDILRKDLITLSAKTRKPIIISTGASKLNEVSNAVKSAKKGKTKNISILHCVSNYPTEEKNCNLKSIKFLRKKFKLKTGWSDHTVNPLLIYSAIKNHGAEIIEMHFDLDKKGNEFNSGHCWTPKESFDLITYIKNEKKIDGKLSKKLAKSEHFERVFKSDPSDGMRPLIKFRDKI